LPLFEREWKGLKLALRQNSLPRVQFAAKTLPKRFFLFLKKGQPYMHVESVLAAAFIWQRGTVI
jgi:hypothetical protein